MRKLIYLFLLVGQLAGAGELPSYQDRFGRAKPVVAVVGENSGTELTDFVIPYGVLARSGAVQLLSVATQGGPLSMRPVLKLQPDATTAEFDQRFPQGADYVIVPAVVKPDDATLVAWVAAHWATESYRKEHYLIRNGSAMSATSPTAR